MAPSTCTPDNFPCLPNIVVGRKVPLFLLPIPHPTKDVFFPGIINHVDDDGNDICIGAVAAKQSGAVKPKGERF